MQCPILTQNTAGEEPFIHNNSHFQDQLIEPVLSSNENINMDISAIDCLEGPTNIVETLSEITTFLVFKYLLTDENITYITFHTNMYANLVYMRNGKS